MLLVDGPDYCMVKVAQFLVNIAIVGFISTAKAHASTPLRLVVGWVVRCLLLLLVVLVVLRDVTDTVHEVRVNLKSLASHFFDLPANLHQHVAAEVAELLGRRIAHVLDLGPDDVAHLIVAWHLDWLAWEQLLDLWHEVFVRLLKTVFTRIE